MTLDAYEERRERLAQLARRGGLDGVLVWSWRRTAVTWLTGYRPLFISNHAGVWIPSRGAAVASVAFPFEIDRFATSGNGLTVRGGAEPWDFVPPDARRVGVLAGDALVPETPPQLAEWSRERNVELYDLRDEVEEWRRPQSTQELERHRAAARMAAEAVAANAVDLAGQSDFELAARAESAARGAGAERCLCLVGIGSDAIISEAHGRVVKPGEPVGIEITLACRSAATQIQYTYLQDDDIVTASALDACHTARLAMLDMACAALPVAELVASGNAALAAAGRLDDKEYDFGHGVGLDTPQRPRLVEDEASTLVAGEVVVVHVAVRNQSRGTAAIGGPVVISSDGASPVLPGAPWELETAKGSVPSVTP